MMESKNCKVNLKLACMIVNMDKGFQQLGRWGGWGGGRGFLGFLGSPYHKKYHQIITC